ncbi:androgen-induced gene 1 protein-like isoform X1 [Tachysurus fulvidraco]|uniref:androgen-induced gene 1 protein-like isoform X1 n=1 Tax=Tachysurus fulvidraco TaxID=1234273 RepID=UPI001FEFF269|nr:androgen-induced gene 1 protein-like isoform X1 [Tachysurus fulvidraco]XP_047663431.1 androgen-induced gene 1 protein-like isoform X1 [Tachysurus fulvidraco]
MASALRSGVNSKLCFFAHVVIFAWYMFTLSANTSVERSGRHPGALTYGGRWKYLTFINLVIQTVFFGLCFVTDVLHMVLLRESSLSSFLVTVQDFFFTVLAFPLGAFVFSSFWSIYSYDRELVFPKALDEVIPTWLNHALHTVILPLLLVQMCLQRHKHPSRCKGIVTLAFFVSLYLAWVLWVRQASGIWVYPIMAHLSPAGLVVFLSMASLCMAPIYLLGEKLTCVIWGPTEKEEEMKTQRNVNGTSTDHRRPNQILHQHRERSAVSAEGIYIK